MHLEKKSLFEFLHNLFIIIVQLTAEKSIGLLRNLDHARLELTTAFELQLLEGLIFL